MMVNNIMIYILENLLRWRYCRRRMHWERVLFGRIEIKLSIGFREYLMHIMSKLSFQYVDQEVLPNVYHILTLSATEGEVWRWNLIDPPYRRLMNTAVGCIGLRERTNNALVIAGESAILTTTMASTDVGSPSNLIPDYATGPRFLAHRPDHMSTTRPNDGRVDRYGNFVVGMYNQYHRAGATEGANNAGLYRLNARTLQWQEILQKEYKFRVSNCICFSGDGTKMYFGDTPTRKVYVFDYSPDGPLTNRKLVWTMPAAMPGAPDGAQVDAQGKLWIAITGGGKVVQVNPDTGTVECIVHVGNANPTSLTFGGRDLDELFITTRASPPHGGGGLWRAKMPFGVRGLPEPEFQA